MVFPVKQELEERASMLRYTEHTLPVLSYIKIQGRYSLLESRNGW